MDMKNLLHETTAILEQHGKTPADVRFVLSTDQEPNPWGVDPAQLEWCTWDEFARKADRKYDAGYGGANVAPELKVVGDDWWLERHEYDGSEWWEFKTIPLKPERHNPRIRIDPAYCDTFADEDAQP